jgi:hypothetical protein
LSNFRVAVGLMSALAAGACSTTTEELRANPGEQGSFHVALPYRTVYINLNKGAESCTRANTNGAHMLVDSGEIELGRFGRVDVVEEGTLGHRVIISTDITATPDGTDVTFVVNKHVFYLTYRSSIVGWANGTGTKCGEF